MKIPTIMSIAAIILSCASVGINVYSKHLTRQRNADRYEAWARQKWIDQGYVEVVAPGISNTWIRVKR